MRIRWNKFGLAHKEINNDINGLVHRNGTVSAVYFCPNCGAEIYGEWKYTLFYNPQNKTDVAIKKAVDDSILEYKNLQAEASSFADLKKCPVCDCELIHDSGFFIQNDLTIDEMQFFTNPICRNSMKPVGNRAVYLSGLDEICSFLKEARKDIPEKKANEALLEIDTLYDVPVAVTVNHDISSEIKSNSQKLQEYLLKIINIEKNINFLKKRLFLLFALSYQANQDANYAKYAPIMATKQQRDNTLEQMRTEFENMSNKINWFKILRKQCSEKKIFPPDVDFPVKPIEPTRPTYATPNIFNKKKVAAENEALTEKYNNDVVLYNKALSEYPILLEQAKQHQAELHRKALEEREKEICEFDEKISKMISELDAYKAEIEAIESDFENRTNQLKTKTEYPAVKLKISLDKEIEAAEELLKDLFKKKHQLYGTDIIFGKYRDIAAITSFYEYLISGRCETLEGVNGCYNLYESELRANIIINKLDAIGDSLETIKGNQYMLYSQLSEINHELNSLNATTTAMFNGIKDATEIFLEHSAVIAYNSAVSAYYSKLNAEIASSDRYISMICW